MDMPKAFTEAEKKLIKASLLEQGYKQFAAFGLKKTNVGELARAAGISKGAFYLFYKSKEMLFMDVVEDAEERVRKEILPVIDLPGPTPRERLFTVFKKALNLFQEMPILHFFTGSDFDLLFRRVPPEKLQEHLTNDQTFFKELVARCLQAGIPIRAPLEQVSSLLYKTVLVMLHQDEFASNNFDNGIDLLLQLVAAFCVGEIKIQLPSPATTEPFSGGEN
jgi:AcrR family transcriptional regulator